MSYDHYIAKYKSYNLKAMCWDMSGPHNADEWANLANCIHENIHSCYADAYNCWVGAQKQLELIIKLTNLAEDRYKVMLAYENTIASLQTAVIQKEQSINALNTKLSTSEQESNNLRNDINSKNNQINQMNNEKTQLISKVNNLESDLKISNKKNAEFEIKNSELLNENQKLQKDLTRLEEAIKNGELVFNTRHIPTLEENDNQHEFHQDFGTYVISPLGVEQPSN